LGAALPEGTPLVKDHAAGSIPASIPSVCVTSRHEAWRQSFPTLKWLPAIVDGVNNDDQHGEIAGHYDKQFPIGEYVPLARWLPWLRLMIAGGGPITPGRPTPLLGVGGVHAGVLVCYEAIVPWVAAAHAAHGAQVLLNLSNDGWYAGSAAPWQLLAQARFRAIEQGVPLVRVANGGPSAVVSATGRLEWVGPASGSQATVVPVRLRRRVQPK
jgi:apolipoprotein N-acyltransferase